MIFKFFFPFSTIFLIIFKYNSKFSSFETSGCIKNISAMGKKFDRLQTKSIFF